MVGAVAGYVGGYVDTAIGRLMDVLLAFPGILLAIALVAVLGPSLVNVVLALVDDRMGGLRAARARPGAEDPRTRVRAGRAGARRAGAARDPAARGAGDVFGRDGAGDARHGRRDPRRGVAQFPGPRRAAADAELGQHARRGALAPVRRAASDDRAGRSRSRCSCWDSTSPATRCAIGSIRGHLGTGEHETLIDHPARGAAVRGRAARRSGRAPTLPRRRPRRR